MEFSIEFLVVFVPDAIYPLLVNVPRLVRFAFGLDIPSLCLDHLVKRGQDGRLFCLETAFFRRHRALQRLILVRGYGVFDCPRHLR